MISVPRQRGRKIFWVIFLEVGGGESSGPRDLVGALSDSVVEVFSLGER